MKNTLILLFVLLLLGGAAYTITQKEEATSLTTVNTNDRNFNVEDVESIGKIFLAERDGQQVLLTRNGPGTENWTLNGKYKARAFAVETILSTLKMMELAFIPPRNAIPNIVEVLGAHGIKVEVYNLNNEKIKTFYVGGMTNNEEGTYMIMEGAEQPYAMKVPTMVGGLRNRFSQEVVDWRDREVFNLKPEDISYVSVEYPKQKSKSFVMEKKAEEFEVRPFYDVTPKKTTPLKKGLVETYIYGFERFVSENIINEYEGRDSISQMVPFAILTVKDKKGAEQIARFHPLRRIGDTGLPLSDEEVLENTAVERYHLDHSGGDYYLVQQRNFGRAFWSYENFFETEASVKN